MQFRHLSTIDSDWHFDYEAHKLAAGSEESEKLQAESAERAARVLAEARRDAARLLRQAIADIDEYAYRAASARRQQDMTEAAAEAAREEAERLLEESRVMRARMAIPAPDSDSSGNGIEAKLLDLRVLAELSR